MVKVLRDFESCFRCPQCASGALEREANSEGFRCPLCDMKYPNVGGTLVLLRNDNDVFKFDDYLSKPAPHSPSCLRAYLEKIIPDPSVNLVRSRAFQRIQLMLTENQGGKVLVVGGGQQRAALDQVLAVNDSIVTLYTDVDIRADVDVFCDGHDLPILDGSIDCVITTAVLEHVLYPERVAEEMQRVLKVGGILYSELPFMQQVHEGAYDFTRYTLSGHKRLFNYIDVLEGGMVAGPATALVWSIENFALAFFDSSGLRKVAKAIVRILLFWVKYFDYYLANRSAAMDGASCTYILGRKRNQKIADSEIIDSYVGMQHMRHS